MNRFGDGTKQWSTDPTTTPADPIISKDAPATWKDFGMSMNAISFGFAATAVLISMFLLMAIFEHFIKPRISSSFNIRGTRGSNGSSLEIGRSHGGVHGKVHNSSKVRSFSLSFRNWKNKWHMINCRIYYLLINVGFSIYNWFVPDGTVMSHDLYGTSLIVNSILTQVNENTHYIF